MITEIYGDILQEPEDVWIVIPINCKGRAGAGLARQWALAHPDANETYIRLCDQGRLQPGGIWWTRGERGSFILAATKDHWRDPSQIEWIESILEALAHRLMMVRKPMTVCLPPIGCGLGGLPWDPVHNLIYYWLGDPDNALLSHHQVYLYAPH